MATFAFSGTPENLRNKISLYAAGGLWVKVRTIKIERGNRATDWSPAPEDVQGDINGLAQGFGFKTQAELSAYLAAPSKGPIFNYDPVTGVLALSSLLAENIAGNNAFVNNLTVKQLRTTGGQVEITDSKQKFGNMEIDQGKVVINGADGRRVELWNTNLTESNAISGGGTIPTTQLIAAMSATSNGVTGSLDATTVSGNSAYFNATVGLGFNCTIVGEVSPFNGIGEVSLYVVDRGGRKELIKTISVIGGGGGLNSQNEG